MKPRLEVNGNVASEYSETRFHLNSHRLRLPEIAPPSLGSRRPVGHFAKAVGELSPCPAISHPIGDAL